MVLVEVYPRDVFHLLLGNAEASLVWDHFSFG